MNSKASQRAGHILLVLGTLSLLWAALPAQARNRGWEGLAPGEAAERLKMCEDCRVIAQFEAKDEVMAAGERPRPRTTDDYLAARESGKDEDDV